MPLAVAASAALYASAPVVVLAADGDAGGQAGAASAAVALGAPMLLTPGASADPADATAVTTEVARLGPQALLAVGQGAQDWAAQKGGGPRVVPAAPEALAGLVKVDVRAARAVDPNALTDAVGGLDRAKPELLTVAAAAATPPAAAGPSAAPVGPVAEAVPDLPVTTPAEPLTGLVVLARSGNDQVAPDGHRPRRRGAGGRAAHAGPPRERRPSSRCCRPHLRRRCWPWAARFGTVDQLAQRLAVVRTGVQLPGGGQLAFPGRRMVALYGTPGTAALGSLGEQDLNGSIARVKNLVAQYQPHSDVPVVPAFEIITTVAAGQPGADGDYSNEVEIAKIRPYVDAAKAAGAYVMLDLQPGRTDFLTQAKRYQELLAEPHVGLALDPEWRLAPGQVHRVQIGSVNVDEINRVGDWLAGLVRERQPAAEGADAPPVPHVDDRRPGAAEHGARRARGHGARRRVRHPGHEARHLEHVAGELAERLLGLEELHRRGPAHARPGPDDAGQPGHRLRLVPVTRETGRSRATRSPMVMASTWSWVT